MSSQPGTQKGPLARLGALSPCTLPSEKSPKAADEIEARGQERGAGWADETRGPFMQGQAPPLLSKMVHVAFEKVSRVDGL